MDNSRLTKRIYSWDKKLNDENIVKTWKSEIYAIFSQDNLDEMFQSGLIFDIKGTVTNIQNSMLLTQQSLVKVQCENMPKLRTFVKFKDFCSTPSYLT